MTDETPLQIPYIPPAHIDHELFSEEELEELGELFREFEEDE